MNRQASRGIIRKKNVVDRRIIGHENKDLIEDSKG